MRFHCMNRQAESSGDWQKKGSWRPWIVISFSRKKKAVAAN